MVCGDPQAKDTKALLQCVHSIYIPNKVHIPADLRSHPTLPPCLSLLSSQHPSFWEHWGGGRGHFPPGSAMPSPLSQVTLCALPRSQVLILADGDPSSFVSRQLPFLNSLRRVEDQATVYIFENQACSMPITDPSELRKLLHQ